jgi:hypothetical protein
MAETGNSHVMPWLAHALHDHASTLASQDEDSEESDAARATLTGKLQPLERT